MHDVAILYAYYDRQPELVHWHHHRLVEDNPGVPIIPIVYATPSYIAGTVDVSGMESVWIRLDEIAGSDSPLFPKRQRRTYRWRWEHADQFYWRYLRNSNRVEAERYVLVEWDTLSWGKSVRDFYRTVWNEDVAGCNVISYKTLPNWNHWNYDALRVLGDRCRSIIPISGTFLSRKAASIVAQTTPPDFLRKSFSENYAATLLSSLGFNVVEVPGANSMIGGYSMKQQINGRDGIYHPVTGVFHFSKNAHDQYLKDNPAIRELFNSNARKAIDAARASGRGRLLVHSADDLHTMRTGYPQRRPWPGSVVSSPRRSRRKQRTSDPNPGTEDEHVGGASQG